MTTLNSVHSEADDVYYSESAEEGKSEDEPEIQLREDLSELD
jgi:hypothetical protein